MKNLLFTVEEVLYIQTLGAVRAVLYPGVSSGGPFAVVGQQITVLRPDGQELKTTIMGYRKINPYGPNNSYAVILPENIKVDDIPIESQVWAAD